MRKNKNHFRCILALILVLVFGILTGCQKDTGDTGNDTADIQIISVSSAEQETEPIETESVDIGNEIDITENEPEVTAEPTVEAEAEVTEAPEEKTEAVTDGAEEKTGAATETKQQYYFRNAKLLGQHYEKHGIEMGFASEEEYEAAASDVINNPKALHKKEKEDNDEVYYVEETNEFAVLSADGYIRTYFYPSAGIKYYNRQ